MISFLRCKEYKSVPIEKTLEAFGIIISTNQPMIVFAMLLYVFFGSRYLQNMFLCAISN